MARRGLTLLLAVCLASSQGSWTPARADNPMGYRLASLQEVGNLPRRGGTLGLDVERARQITDSGMTFALLNIKKVRSRSAGAAAGFKPGDQIIGVDGLVFPTVNAFASYVASRQPGSQIMVDYIPARGQPANAQRVAVAVGSPNGAVRPDGTANVPAGSGGMSTGTKLAIGAGAAAILCYKLGCFSRKDDGTGNPGSMMPMPQPAR